jgi:hypothetical protein
MSTSVASGSDLARRFRGLRVSFLLEEAGLRSEVLEVLVHLDRAVRPIEGLVQIDVVSQAVGRRSVPALPGEAGKAAQLGSETFDDDRRCVDLDVHGHGGFFPAENHCGGAVGRIGEGVAQAFLERGLRRRHGDAQGVFLRVITEAAPGVGHLAEDDGPLLFRRDHVESIGAGRERLALDLHGRADRERRVLVGSGAPDFAVRDELSPDLALVDRGAVIVNRDLGQTHRLAHEASGLGWGRANGGVCPAADRAAANRTNGKRA